MSISDTLMWRYFELLLNTSKTEISQMQERVAAGNLHPMSLKKDMAHKIIAKFWSSKEADEASDTFESVFQKKDYSKAQEVKLPSRTKSPIWVVDLLKAMGAIKNSSEAKRLIEAHALSIDGQLIVDFKASISWKSGMIIKAGKQKIYQLV